MSSSPTELDFFSTLLSPLPPPPSSSSSSSSSSYADIFEGLSLFLNDSNQDDALAADIDEFSSFLSTTPSSSPLKTSSSSSSSPPPPPLVLSSSSLTLQQNNDLIKTIDQWFPTKTSTSAKSEIPNFDDLSSFTFSQNEFEKFSSPFTFSPFHNNNMEIDTTSSSSSSLKLKIPRISNQIQPTSSSEVFFAHPIPDHPGLFVASQDFSPPSLSSLSSFAFNKQTQEKTEAKKEEIEEEEVAEYYKVSKRKRCADYFSTDGELFAVLINKCKKSCTCGSSSSSSNNNKAKKDSSLKELLVFKQRRAQAKAKLERKKKMRAMSKFNGHYPDRKAVACARRRVGGRFVKEDLSVFRPVKQATLSV